MGAIMHQWSRHNQTPEVLDYLDKLGSRAGIFNAGDWNVARQGLEKTGFANMGHRQAMLPDELAPNMAKTAGQQFLDAGLFFLRGTDRHLRYSSWYTSFAEWRAKNPTGVPGNREWGEILNRADMLSGNMSQASKSNLQRGIFAPAAQFTTFMLRQWEMFTGKRLTGVEKTRLLTTYGALFGLPGAAGLIAGPLPAGDLIRRTAMDNGYIQHDNEGSTTLMEGLFSQLGHLVSGKDFDFGKRFGEYGFFSEDLLKDKGWWDTVTGASGSFLSNVYASSHPFVNMIGSFMRGDGKFTPKWDHFKQVAKNVNTLNIIDRGAQAVSTGKWLSRNGTILQNEVDPYQAIFQSVTGTTTQALQDVQNMDWSTHAWETRWKSAEREFIPEFRRGLQSMHDKDPEQANEYFNNARYYLQMASVPQERWSDILRKATNEWESVVTKTEWDYYNKNRDIPEGQALQRNELFQKMMKLRGK